MNTEFSQEPTETELTEQLSGTTQALAPRRLLLGDVLPSFDDVILSRLNIVQNLSKSKEYHSEGSLIFGPAPHVCLYAPSKTAPAAPVIISVLGIASKRFMEDVKFGVQGAIVSSEEEVAALNGCIDRDEAKVTKKKLFVPLVDIMVAIQRPYSCPDDGATFTFPVKEEDGTITKYAVGLWALKNTSYTAAYKRVIGHDRFCGCLREGGYPSYSYELTTAFKLYPNGHQTWLPVLKAHKPSTQAFMAFAKEIIEGPAS